MVDDATNVDFNHLLQSITKNDLVLVASKNFYEKCAKKLQNVNIKYIDGITFAGKKINQIINDNKTYKNIGVVIGSHADEIFFCEIYNDLSEFQIVYFVSSLDDYRRFSLKKRSEDLVILARHSILEEVTAIDLMLIVNEERTSREVLTINLTHSFQGACSYPFLGKNTIDFIREAYFTINCVVVGGKRIHQEYESFFESQNIRNCKILDIGYMKLSEDYKKYLSYVSKRENNIGDMVLFCFTYLFENKADVINLISELLNASIKVCIMPHPIFNEEVVEVCEKKFGIYDNFFMDSNFDSRNEIFSKALCAITDYSSMGYTFPLITGKEVIIYARDKEEFLNKNYFDSRLHSLCSSPCEVLSTINKISHNERREQYQKAILDYRKNECFNFYGARSKVVSEIKNFIKSKEKNESNPILHQ